MKLTIKVKNGVVMNSFEEWYNDFSSNAFLTKDLNKYFSEAAWNHQQEIIDSLKARLEVDPSHSVDGIEARDFTIEMLESIIEELKGGNNGSTS